MHYEEYAPREMFEGLDGLKELIQSTGAPIVPFRRHGVAVVHESEIYSSRPMCAELRAFWKKFVEVLYAYSWRSMVISCTVRCTLRGEELPPSRWDRVLRCIGYPVVPKYGPDRVKHVVIPRPDFSDAARWILEDGKLSLVVPEEEYEKLVAEGLRGERFLKGKSITSTGERGYRIIVPLGSLEGMLFKEEDLCSMFGNRSLVMERR